MKEKWEYTWKAFWIKNLKAYMPVLPMLFLMWNGVEYGRVVHEYFGWAYEGYGPPQQRWYRALASVILLVMLFGSVMNAIITWHYLKNPDEIPSHDDENN